MKQIFWFLAILRITLAPLMAPGEDYPPIPKAEDTSAYGKHFQRTMTLLATSSPERRNKVRILYYGQSIIGQRWSDQVDADLRRRFPDADIETENRAIGGFSSQFLVRTMYYDVFPFYPDLIVFHVYGSHTDYESIIREMRRNTSAEIIMQTDHANTWPEPKAESSEKQESWNDRMCYWFLPDYAQKYGCALQPQQIEWVQYLKTNNLEPPALLSDSVHLNDHGKWLMAELLNRFMVYLPDAPQDEWRDLVKTYEVGKDVNWEGDRLTMEFDGNRVEALAGPDSSGKVRVLIDGKKPGDIPECYAFTRPSGTPGVGWPVVRKISHNAPVVAEEWTATFKNFNEEQDDFEFEIAGSVTGSDGGGRGNAKFVSNSGRIVIEPEDWVFAYCKSVSKKSAPDGFQARWSVIPQYIDAYEPGPAPDGAREYGTTLAQGFPNDHHKLELIVEGENKPSIKAIRVSRPPAQ